MAVSEQIKLSNQPSTLLSSEFWHSNNNGMISYEVWQRLSNNILVYFAYYAGIMLDAFGYPLCFYYHTVGNFRGSNFSCFGELRRFRRFIFLWRISSNHLVI